MGSKRAGQSSFGKDYAVTPALLLPAGKPPLYDLSFPDKRKTPIRFPGRSAAWERIAGQFTSRHSLAARQNFDDAAPAASGEPGQGLGGSSKLQALSFGGGA
jgi:hypothetical protein